MIKTNAVLVVQCPKKPLSMAEIRSNNSYFPSIVFFYHNILFMLNHFYKTPLGFYNYSFSLHLLNCLLFVYINYILFVNFDMRAGFLNPIIDRKTVVIFVFVENSRGGAKIVDDAPKLFIGVLVRIIATDPSVIDKSVVKFHFFFFINFFSILRPSLLLKAVHFAKR